MNIASLRRSSLPNFPKCPALVAKYQERWRSSLRSTADDTSFQPKSVVPIFTVVRGLARLNPARTPTVLQRLNGALLTCDVATDSRGLVGSAVQGMGYPGRQRASFRHLPLSVTLAVHSGTSDYRGQCRLSMTNMLVASPLRCACCRGIRAE